jgi:hypothetical protein
MVLLIQNSVLLDFAGLIIVAVIPPYQGSSWPFSSQFDMHRICSPLRRRDEGEPSQRKADRTYLMYLKLTDDMVKSCSTFTLFLMPNNNQYNNMYVFYQLAILILKFICHFPLCYNCVWE